MLIRHADVERDAAACAAIYAPFVTGTVISLEEVAPDEHGFRLRMERITRTHPWLVAEEGDQVVGYAYGGPHRDRASYRWSTDVTVYLSPTHHRQGIGRRLYEVLMDLLRAQGFYMACAGITLPNEASLGLHRALGFEEVGVYRRIGYKFGAWRDVLWMQAPLRDPDGPPAEAKPPARGEGA